ncbi:hypothetical protein GIB67_021812 [Kingdonia uniflora]|uniref:Uncharacterized protein n=1 Tax=Kingdonia uniflora TaxID=39325 RepID=A0A7J7P789_9MAGN|nr:hypothetical protein GIB67_021812 [Kingdonia uniflora]
MYFNFGYTPKASDMLSTSWFLSSRTLTKLEQFFKPFGIGPMKLLKAAENCSSDPPRQRFCGKLPEKVLLKRCRTFKFVKFPICGGMEPES